MRLRPEKISNGNIIVSDNKLSSANQFIIVESDCMESPYSGRIIKVDQYGNVLWTFGNGGYLVNARDAGALNCCSICQMGKVKFCRARLGGWLCTHSWVRRGSDLRRRVEEIMYKFTHRWNIDDVYILTIA